MLRSRLAWKLGLGVALPGLLATTLTAWLMLKLSREALLRAAEESLAAQAALLASQISNRYLDAADPKLQSWLRLLTLTGNPRITLLDVDGRVLGDSEREPSSLPNLRDEPEVLAALYNRSGKGLRRTASAESGAILYARAVGDPGKPSGVVRLELPLTTVDFQQQRLRRWALLCTALSSAILAILGFMFARRTADAVDAVSVTAKRIQAGDYQPSELTRRRDEIGALSNLLQQMGGELKQRIDTIEQDRVRLAAILTSMVEGVIAVDADDRILFWNAASLRLLQLREPLSAGAPLREQVRLPEVHEMLGRVRAQKGVLPVAESGQHVIVHSDIHIYQPEMPRLLAAHASLFSLQEKRGILLVFQDITEVRRLEKIRQEFVANASHELKTPVTVIKGYVETLLDGAMNRKETRQRFLVQIFDNVNHLAALIDDLLLLSQVESPQQKLKLETLEARGQLEMVVDRMAAAAQRKGLTLALLTPEVQRQMPLLVQGHTRALQEILQNLIDNAIKYTNPPGSIVVSIHQQAPHIVYEIVDTGIGIQPADLERIFERFYRADKARSRAVEGTGLGLSIVKHLLQELGGEITVESSPGKGSRFQVFLPAATSV